MAQQNTNYTILFVDDASEYTKSQKKHIKEKLKGHIVVFNKERKYSLRNAYEMIHTYAEKPNSVIVNVDGDDWLLRNDVIDIVQQTYTKKPETVLTYGNCIYHAPRTEKHLKKGSDFAETNHRFPKEVEEMKNYRNYFFLPLHLRTWRIDVFKKIPIEYFLRPNSEWIEIGEDQAIFIPLLEISEKQYEVILKPLYVYNTSSQNNDSKIHRTKRLIDEVFILKKPKFTLNYV